MSDSSPVHAAVESAFAPGIVVHAARVLVIEDDKITQAVVVEQLRALGMAADGALDGAQASALLAHGDYDIALVDMFLPDTTGLDLVRQIHEQHPGIEVVVVTGHPTIRDAVACVQAGAVDYLEKPFDLDQLSALVQRALMRQRACARLAILEATQAILAIHEPDELPAAVVEAAVRLLNADDASVMLVAADGYLELTCSASLDREECKQVRQAVGEGVAGRVAQTRRPVVVMAEADSDPRFRDLSPSRRPIQSSIVYPLVMGSRLLGVLSVSRMGDGPAFAQRDLDGAGVLVSQVCLAVENARLVGELQARVAELSSTQRRLVQTERLASIGQLAGGIAHEVNNPVAYVVSNLDYVKRLLARLEGLPEGASGEDARDGLHAWWEGIGKESGVKDLVQALGEAHEGALRIRDIVADMRSLARVDGVCDAELDLNHALRSALRLSAANTRRRARMEVDYGQDVCVQGSAGQLSQVFLNLLNNAADAVEGRRDKPCIRVRTWREGDRVMASVADNGGGLGEETARRLFEPFYTTKPAGEGTGLGLAICRDVVTRHGGELRFESRPGEGACFHISLPAAKTAALHDGAPGSPETRARTRRGRLLFVDDEPSLLSAYVRRFGRDNDVVTAGSGDQALAILAKDAAFDLIVCDLVMPGMSGMALYREACSRHPELAPRFVLTTGGVADGEMRAFLSGFAGVTLNKPFRMSRIDALLAARIAPQHDDGERASA